MNELAISLADKLDMTYEGVVNAYPEIANQIMYYNIIGSLKPLLWVALVLSIVALYFLIKESFEETDDMKKLLRNLESLKISLHYAVEFADNYGDDNVEEKTRLVEEKQQEIKALEEKERASKGKNTKYIKYALVLFTTSVLLLVGTGVLTNIMAKDFIALKTILSGVNY